MAANRTMTPEVFTGLLVAGAFTLALACCNDSSENTPSSDGGADTPVADVVDDADSGGDLADAPTGQDPREVVALAVSRACIGCDRVSWCGKPPMSDATAVTVDAAPNNQSGLLFAAERWEWHGRSLPVDTCQTFIEEPLEPVVTPPSGLVVLDAGPIHFSGEMPVLTPAMTSHFHDVTHNYDSAARLVSVGEGTEYTAGAALSLEAEGGQDLPAFSADATACETMEILTPHTDEDGQIDNLPADEPIHVTWTGGGDFERVVIILEAYYCPWDWTAMVLCNATNDGDFTIPAEMLDGIDWANVAELYVMGSIKWPLEVDGLEGAPVWSVRSAASLPVYHDPEAMPVEYDCTRDHMEEGYVGNACDDEADCGGGCCLPEVQDVYFFENYCSLLHCDDNEDCPADAACVQNPHPQVPWDTFCAKVCTDDSDCRFPEYACLPTDSGATVCRPNFW